MHYTKFPKEVMTEVLQAIRDFQRAHDGKPPGRLHLPTTSASTTEAASPDSLGPDIGKEVHINGARSVSRAVIDGIELAIVWDAETLKVTE